jgi:hypothetical protein
MLVHLRVVSAALAGSTWGVIIRPRANIVRNTIILYYAMHMLQLWIGSGAEVEPIAKRLIEVLTELIKDKADAARHPLEHT